MGPPIAVVTCHTKVKESPEAILMPFGDLHQAMGGPMRRDRPHSITAGGGYGVRSIAPTLPDHQFLSKFLTKTRRAARRAVDDLAGAAVRNFACKVEAAIPSGLPDGGQRLRL